ncbi:Ada metal-binding domain-containing protein [Kitasatospora sp. NPDC058170]|uniref:Ada metal-binding domain-containing protein n=1 Tax=Kitasatospora sp. NPDC058170 TaxID=3346364 RepID=UPI0036DBDC38
MSGADTTRASGRDHLLLGADGRPYRSAVPGTLGGHRRGRLYGRLDCPSALRAIAAGGYVRHRVFFADAATARAAGYRPCAVCLPEAYARWRARRPEGPDRQGDTMSSPHGFGRPRSPLAPGPGGPPLPPPAAHTPAELASLLGLLTGPPERIRSVVIGHGRAEAATAAARALAEAWRARGGEVLAVVDWPEAAASWLRPATRFTAATPDAWVVAGGPEGWAQMSRRLRFSTDWDPARTFGFASIGTVAVVERAGADVLHGMRGASADGGTWRIGGELITYHPPADGS